MAEKYQDKKDHNQCSIQVKLYEYATKTAYLESKSQREEQRLISNQTKQQCRYIMGMKEDTIPLISSRTPVQLVRIIAPVKKYT